ncbi:glycosyltransferase family 2 protein [Patescibacteria group bacterium]|nr:glycosyltransferase family 2 protein [Patescibacteria group bacterium]MCL5091219.1 glycosyltransferase family 2 protein [Patescibacteria group bacterium]
MIKPDLTIIIPSYNTRAITLNCLESIFRSIRTIHAEVIVVDNRSGDNSVEAIRAWTSQHHQPHLSWKIVANQDNLGFAKANNLGTKLATGDYILFLNSDIVVKDAAIERLLDHYRHHETHIGFLGGRLLNPDGTPQPSCGPMYRLPMVFAHLFLRGDYWGLTRASPNRETQTDWVSGACILTKKACLETLGGFDENIFMYMEEIDLFYRAKQRGYLTYYYPGAQFVHLGSASSRGRTYPIVQVFKGLRYFYKKHFSILDYKILTVMLKLKAVGGILAGRITRNRYLLATYENAYKIACLD